MSLAGHLMGQKRSSRGHILLLPKEVQLSSIRCRTFVFCIFIGLHLLTLSIFDWWSRTAESESKKFSIAILHLKK